ncbi:glycosyltransferase family 2 protein [Candidatus Ruminimicrobium bovinum]|uniref:glycosyltransferase family 2 protein n=1 Tax=Candidatus Ruminimicrobium bovinum TaxID=3242779 RepID=UPI0039B875B4
MNNPKVSVIVPVYNVEQYLKQCLDSILNQTLKDIELICVNDGSTDKSGQILDDYAKRDNRIKVFHKKNEGYGKAMNVGFHNASGEYIGIVEPDDYINSDMYENLYKKVVENDVDFIKADFYSFICKNGNIRLFYNRLDESGKYYNRVINLQEDMTPFKFVMNTWCGIYKRSFIEKYHIAHNETPGASFQDQGFWFQTFCRAKKVYFLNQPYYMYRSDNVNSSVHNKEKIFCIKEEYDYIRKFLEKNPDIKAKFLGIYSYYKFCNYEYNFFRVSFPLKKYFFEVFTNDFKDAYKNKEIDESLFSKWGVLKLRLIMFYPKLYYWYKLLCITNIKMFIRKNLKFKEK